MAVIEYLTVGIAVATMVARIAMFLPRGSRTVA
jgi:hypothetical protein